MKLTLNALFDYVNNDGIFTYLNEFDVPWKNAIDFDLLDLDYHSKHGTKVVSKTITSLITPDGLSRDNKTKLAKLLYKKNKAKWDSLWTSIGLFDEVDPLDNTNWTETRTLGHQGSDSRSQSIGAKETTYNKGSQTNSETIGQSTLTEGQQSNITGQQTISMEEKKSAFNSTNYSPLDQKTEQLGQRTDTLGEKVNTDSGRSNSTTEGQRSDSTTEGAQSNSETGTNNFTDTETTNRHGNIGVTTTGQLIRDFRTTVNWQFFDIIYKDIDEMLVIEIYGKEDDDFDDYSIVTSYVLPVASATKLGGIKVGQNLQIETDGTLKVVMETGVDSVNGKTGIVLLNSEDVGAASSSDLNALSNIVNLQGQTIGQQGQSIDGINNNIAGINTNIGNIEQEITNIRQVPNGGNIGQVLTKDLSGYNWKDPSGGGGGIDIPYVLEHGFIYNFNGLSDWTVNDANNSNSSSYVFDVGNYVGKFMRFYVIPSNIDGFTDRHRFAFLPDIDLKQSHEAISNSLYIGCKSNSFDSTLWGQVLISPGAYGWDNNTDTKRTFQSYPFNFYEGVIPTGMRYFVVYAYSNPPSVDFYNTNLICKCTIFN